MDLKKFLPSLNDKEKIEHYWALVIEPGYVQAGIWRILNQKAQVIYTSVDSAWELDEELVNACDTALSSAIQSFPEGYEEPKKTVFGVSYNWVTGGDIKPEFLEKIKKVCKELSLTPVGFVVLPEAVSNLIKSEEGTPLNAIILGVYKENVELSLFQLGKLLGTTQISRSVSLVDDVVEGINRLSTGDTLPSRFLIYDGKEGDLEDIRQSLLKSNWDNLGQIKFLHTPKVELIDTKRKIFSVALAGASEIANVTVLEDSSSKNVEPEEVSPEEFSNEAEGNIVEEDQKTTPEEMGFSLEEDIRPVATEILKEETENVSDYQDIESNVKLVNEADFSKDHAQMASHVSELFDQRTSGTKENLSEKEEIPNKPVRPQLLKSFRGSLFKIFSPAKRIHFALPRLKLSNTPFVVGGLTLVLLVIAFGLFWWFVPKATVTIFVSPLKLEEATEITVDLKSQNPDATGKVIPGKLLETSVTGDRTADTTGTKTIGDKAKGELTIYRVGPELLLSVGTVFTGPDKLKFVLDNASTIASGSGITTPGETKVAVTAQDIGSQSNLASGATFSVGNYSTSDMEAKNLSAFAGGSSKEVSAVSKDDQSALLKSLESELKDTAKVKLTENIAGDTIFIEASEKTTDTETVFDKKVGDEAKTLKLSLTVSASAISVSKKDLTAIAKEELTNKVPKGFVLRDEQLSFSFESGDPIGNTYKFKVKVSANLLPNLKTDDIAKKIAGRYTSLAEDYLKKEAPGFVKTEIRIKPTFPGKLKTLPHVVKNIEVVISAEK